MVEPAQSNNYHPKIRKWLAKRFAPVATVFSSPVVRKELWEKSGLQPAELLRPFGQVGSLNNIPLQTCERGVPFNLVNFHLDFVDVAKIDGKSP